MLICTYCWNEPFWVTLFFFLSRFHPELILLDTSIYQTKDLLALFGAAAIRDLLDNCWTPRARILTQSSISALSQKDISGSTNFVYISFHHFCLRKRQIEEGESWSCICNSNIDTSVSKKISRERKTKDELVGSDLKKYVLESSDRSFIINYNSLFPGFM